MSLLRPVYLPSNRSKWPSGQAVVDTSAVLEEDMGFLWLEDHVNVLLEQAT